MKIKHLAIGLIAATTLYSCGGGEAPATETPAVEETEVAESASETFTVDASASEVTWKGEVAGVYGHNGLISISEGSLEVENGALVGGSFTIDMTTINPTDEGYKDEDGHRASDLVGHLATGDFFLVDSFPTATFVITSVSEGQVTGDLTIKGKTQEQVVTVNSLEISETGVSATGEFVFNRQDFGVAWVHYMKDMVLSDDISVGISINATK